MTIVEMHTRCDELIDKADAPWFTPEQKDIYLNVAQTDFVENEHKIFEVTERGRESLSTIVKVQNYTNTKILDIDTITRFMFVLDLSGEFPNACKDGTVWRSIKAEQLQDITSNQNDPFNKNDDSKPGYIQYDNGTNRVVEIYSDSIPTNISLKYLQRPVDVLNDEQNPANNIDCELPVFTHEEIVRRAVEQMLGTLQDQLGYQIAQSETNESN
jgi:hypothetical protein